MILPNLPNTNTHSAHNFIRHCVWENNALYNAYFAYSIDFCKSKNVPKLYSIPIFFLHYFYLAGSRTGTPLKLLKKGGIHCIEGRSPLS